MSGIAIRSGLLLSLVVVSLSWLAPAKAEARRLVIFGGGETASAVEEILPEHLEQVRAQTGAANPVVGYKYEYFSLFFLDLWTFEGEYVLLDDDADTFWEAPGPMLEQVTGKSVDDFGKPLLYRFPLGLTLIVLAGLWVVVQLGIAYKQDFG